MWRFFWLTWGFSPTFLVAELPLLIGQLKLHFHVFSWLAPTWTWYDMVESVSFHGTHCPFWLSALRYAQGMWPQAFRYISPAATSWPQRVSPSSARRMLPSDSQRWVEHVGTISWRYVKTNSSEMYKRKKKLKSQEPPYLQNDINGNFISNLWQGFAMGFSCFPWVFPGFSQEWNGPFTQPSAYCSRLTARYMWTAWGRPGFGALRGGDGSLLPLPLRGWEASKRALICFEKWKMIGGSPSIQNLA